MECWGITSACGTPGFPVLPNLLEFAQAHVLPVRQGCKKTILNTSSLKSPYIIPLQSVSCNLGHNSASKECNMHASSSSEPPSFWVTHSIPSGLAQFNYWHQEIILVSLGGSVLSAELPPLLQWLVSWWQWNLCSSNSSLKKIVSVAPQTGLFLWWPLEVDLTVGKGICKGFLTQILLY